MKNSLCEEYSISQLTLVKAGAYVYLNINGGQSQVKMKRTECLKKTKSCMTSETVRGADLFSFPFINLGILQEHFLHK